MDISLVTTAVNGENYSWLRSHHGAGNCIPGTLDVSKLTAGVHYDAYGRIPSGLALSLNEATGQYEPFASATSEVQSATVTGVPTGGTFTLTWQTETTAAIAYNATAAVVKAALEGLGLINPGDVVVTGVAGGSYTITFAGQYVGQNVPALTATASLTGGTTPGVTIATVTAGGTAPGTDGVLDGFLYTSTQLRAVFTTLVSTVVEIAVLKHGIIVPANCPLAPALNTSTPTTGEFVFVNVPHV
jgi:hypothetical protein